MTTPEKKPIIPNTRPDLDSSTETKIEENRVKEKPSLSDRFENFKNHEKVDGFLSHMSSNTRDTLAYILMIVGIVLLFTDAFYGGTIIGFVVGLYFSDEIMAYLKSLNSLIESTPMVKNIIVGLLFLALFVSAPSLFLGLAIALALKQVLFANP